MREHLVELAVELSAKRVEYARAFIEQSREHAALLRNSAFSEMDVRRSLAEIHDRIANERELTEKCMAVNSTLTREELDYLQGELVRVHADVFMPPEVAEALAKDRMR